MVRFLTRFAPSPTGYLHLGHAYSALIAFDAARAANGQLLLRIEDIDQGRARDAFEDAIYEDLAWLGLSWPEPVRRQSDHLAEYTAARDALIAQGVLYRCFKTRKEVLADIARAPHGGEDAVYPGPSVPLPAHEEEARLARGDAFAWRLSIARCRERLGTAWEDLAFVEEGRGPNGESGAVRARPERLGDVVIARKDVGVSYHLAVAHDDARQGVTHVVRGEDLFEAAHLHRLLQALLDLPTPRYRHHRLICDADGKRLAKRDEAATLRAWRARGATPADVRERLGLAATP